MSIAKEVDFVSGVTPVSEGFMDLFQEMLAGYVSPNFLVEIQSTTQVRVPAGNDAASVGIAIAGEFRRRDTNVSATVSGGAGTKSIYATADSGDNLFALEVTGGAPAATKFRKVGEVDWSGTTITAIRQEWPLSTKLLGLSSDPLAAVPVGSVFEWPYSAAPSGYLLCQGQEVSRSTYAVLNALAAADSYPHGAGNGTTTFHLPDLRRRIPIGKADSGSVSTLGQTTGSWDHAHTGPSHVHSTSSHVHTMGTHTHSGPSHTHTVNDHTHGVNNHNHGGATGDTDGVHSHTFSDSFSVGSGSISTSVGGGSTVVSLDGHTHSGSVSGSTSSTGAHGHGIINQTGLTTGIGGNDTNSGGTGNTGATDPGDTNSAGGADTGSAGTGSTGVANPPVLVMNFIIRAA